MLTIKEYWQIIKQAYIWNLFHRKAWYGLNFIEERIAKKIESKDKNE